MANNGSVLVTGASGYIGSHCIVTLLEGNSSTLQSQIVLYLYQFRLYLSSWI